jgi:hypothetical protein
MVMMRKKRMFFVGLLLMFPIVLNAAGLTITRIQLYFDNNRPEITIKRNYPLKVYAEIGFNGTGLLEGYWEVDGEFLANVKIMLPSGNKVVIESPDNPTIPAFVSGTHKLRFIITRPSMTITFPQAIYFVTTDEWKDSQDSTSPDCTEVPLKGGK